MEERYFSRKVVEWYQNNKRDLPWRATRDPYKIWLSEIILQQTRVAQGLPYYLRFIEAFPDVFSLAAASEQQVLRLWQGLGYYSRARNLHRCARQVVADFNGIFPRTYAELLVLPGIGSYTAAAIASICSRESVAVVDGNVFRVLSRVFGIETDIASQRGKKEFEVLANRLIRWAEPDEFNQAVMEFGALWCTPRQPRCEECPFRQTCFAFQKSLQTHLPVKTKPKRNTRRYFYYFVVRNGDSLLMKQRKGRDIWQGLYDFFLIERSKATKPERLITENLFLKNLVKPGEKPAMSASYKHILSHQTIISRFVFLGDESEPAMVEEDEMEYVSLKKIGDLPKPVLITRFLTDYNFL